ncbi:MAG: 4-hydroxy-tetrahydrodipicolinate synthase [Candidatus Saganbacteria bacterium]|nr:4-hydroxy-tetrahydrodipicolinate synthase [Candidatus Saganbacteria bacterium]
MVNLGKVITAMVTPMKPDMSVDYARAEELAVRLLANGSDGLVLHGTTGESPTLLHDEEYELYRVVKKAVGNKGSVIAVTGSNSTETTIHSTREAEKIGCDAALLVVPYYNRPPQEGLYQHFKAVADKTGLPLIIYNIPGRTGVNMLPDTIARVAQIKNYVGVKEAAGSADQVSDIRAKTPKDFIIWSGDDSLTLPFLSVGAEGVISVASHLAGKEISDMVKAYFSGDVKKAGEIHFRLLPLFKVLFITSNPIMLKAAMEMTGFSVGKPRLPLIEANDKEKEILKKVLREFTIIK